MIAPPLSPAPCSCARARLEHGWCDACSVGFVASFPVASRELYETIHPHGHVVFADKTRCPTCRQAIRQGGWCQECHAGYVQGQAYFSKLTYLLVQGQIVDARTLTCARCRECASRHGWCDACRVGWAGNVRFGNRTLFDQAVGHLDVFFTAVEVLDRCTECAIAIICDVRCARCRITYLNGEPVPTPAPRHR